MQEALFPKGKDHVFSVSELTREIKASLEDKYSDIWITGEISNFHAHSSGHYYFTLKDEHAQITAVMFRGSNRHLKFKLEDGLEILAKGHVSVYEPRGNYQIILEYLEPKGLGALQLAFEQLRNKLQEEGLFDAKRKRPLPFLPKTVGIVTSPTGAAIRDLIHVLHRRNPQTNILLYPVSVQGEAAAPQIAEAINQMNLHGESELLIIGRGGGSLEDLWAFNTEIVARALATSHIPTISAVGHETDFTISDFVADLRAPTPSAAAELAVPLAFELEAKVQGERIKLEKIARQILAGKRGQLKFWTSHLKHPKRYLEDLSLHLSDLLSRIHSAMENKLTLNRSQLGHLMEKLEVLSPLSILSRGFSITHLLGPKGKEGKLVKKVSQVKKGDGLLIRVTDGSFKARVS